MSDENLTPGVKDGVAQFVADWSLLKRGKRQARPVNDEAPLQLPTKADMDYFIREMDAEISRITSEANELQKLRLAEIAQADAQIAALNRAIEQQKAANQAQEDEIGRRTEARVKLVAAAKLLAPHLDASKLNEDGIRREIVRGKFGDAAVDGRHQGYIDARFDVLAETAPATVDPFAALARDGVRPVSARDEVEAARSEFIHRLTNSWRQ